VTLIKSISGIRGTIGGLPGQGLTPPDIVKYTAAFGLWLQKQRKGREACRAVVGRDARISGGMVHGLVTATLTSMGVDVIDLGLSTTPTTELAVAHHKAQGGIVITASHNPKNWNALKLLNRQGEFLSAGAGDEILRLGEAAAFPFAEAGALGGVLPDPGALQRHVAAIVSYALTDREAVARRKFKVVVDAVNSTGGIAVPALLEALGVESVFKLNCEPDGQFAHNPEPLAEHLEGLCKEVVRRKADVGIAVDPDVDRLVLVSEDGELFGEEYTLVAVADYVLGRRKGNTVSNLSSTRALRDVTEKAGGRYFASAVGEVNVVEMMKEQHAVVGGEGNGGVIVPDLHYGRDALAGIALFLSHLARFGKSCSMLRARYPDYFISKNKIELQPGLDLPSLFSRIQAKYKKQPVNTLDGLKIEFGKEWVHLRASNTEPILRIYAESESETTADNLAEKIIQDIRELMSAPVLR
jgi:phosphomannomutase